MFDSSETIQPKSKPKTERVLKDIGEVKSWMTTEDGVEFTTDLGILNISFYNQETIRIYFRMSRESLPASRAVILPQNAPDFQVIEDKNGLTVISEKLHVIIKKTPLRISIFDASGRLLFGEGSRGTCLSDTGEVFVYKQIHHNSHYYGLGEKTGFLNKRGETFTMWNTDVYAPHNPETDPLYQSIPFFLELRDGTASGLFLDCSAKSTFDFRGNEDSICFTASDIPLDYYVFLGPSPADVIRQYTRLTGRMPLPPKWALGYHQSRYSYETEEEVRQIAETFREKEIPLDAIYLDIHYMDEYRVFTFHKNRFPNPKSLIRDLKNKGIHTVPIVDPGIKKDPEFTVYRDAVKNDMLCKYVEGNVYSGNVWPGESVFPDFTNQKVRKWWGDIHQFYTMTGIEGIWNDMNEPAVFNETKTMDEKVLHQNEGEPRTHRQLHNIYGLLMTQATYEGLKRLLRGRRPFVLTRAGYAGIQRYAAVWTGDNRSFWEHLQMSLPMCMNLGISGVAFCGADVGGFAHHTNGELLVRWTQAACFMPFFRNHSAHGFARQEPWCFGENYEQLIKKAIEWRYELLPYFYSLFYQSSCTGLPVMRPLFLENPFDESTYSLYDQFLVGEDLLVAPILEPGKPVRTVYLPKGNWFDYWTEEVYHGGQFKMVEAELDRIPLFVKNGAVIAKTKPVQSTAIQNDELEIHIYSYQKKSFCTMIYEDDGETFRYQNGDYFKLKISGEWNGKRLNIKGVGEGHYPVPWRKLRFVFHGEAEQFNSAKIYYNNKRKKVEKESNGLLSFSVKVK